MGEDVPVSHPGLRMLHTVKLSGCPFADFGLTNLIKVAPNISHLELSGCETLTEYGVKTVIDKLPRLKYIDMSRIPIVNYGFLDELKQRLPNLLTKRYKIAELDKKDNGLRVPRRVI